MKTDQLNLNQIRNAFSKMQSRQDFLNLLNLAKPMVYGSCALPFELKQITWYANNTRNKNKYKKFTISKKSGAKREIHAPVRGLKAIQKTLSFVLQCVYEPHLSAFGFVKNKSIVDNARVHEGSRYVYNIDLKDFFHSIDQARIWKCLQLDPFNLKGIIETVEWADLDVFAKEILKTDKPLEAFEFYNGRLAVPTELGWIYIAKNFDFNKEMYVILADSQIKSKRGENLEGTLWLVNKIPQSDKVEIANIISNLCCSELEVERKNEAGKWEIVKRNVLPQGAPTSPVITNIVCNRLDRLLTGVAKRFGLKYSRYADDITFSSMHNMYQQDSDFIKELNRIIKEQGFHVKESKTRLQKEGYRKEVTGLLVNEHVNVQKRYIKQLRMWLYYWERYGYERASDFFSQQYLADKGIVKNGKPDMIKIIAGKLDYLKMVKGADNNLYMQLKFRYAKLTNTEKLQEERYEYLNRVIDLIFDKGLNDAMDYYNPIN
jgi:hypothetical protein